MGYMEIGDDPRFTVVCYCDHQAEVESEAEASIDEKFGATIDEKLEAPIDSDHANEIDDFPEGSINSLENDYYQPSFVVHTAIPSKRKINTMEKDEYDENYREEEII
ncbi:hypothetical protein F2Q70_00017253 [Brassica cretica]|uniref:Uncharacterized protein n=1 Tax=Brassica cretica TaxID=69181 RepID=A0A8S9HQ48_BRACR|nr:hypothetical protein F2Q70_00017253 [Brassica cretica]